MAKTEAKKIVQTLKKIYTPLSLFFLVIFAWQNQSLLGRIFAEVKTQYLLQAIFCWSAAHLLTPLTTKAILANLGSKLPYTRLLMIHISRLPARYIPGGIWHTVGRVADLHTDGISKTHLTLLVIAESIVPCLIAFLIGGGYLLFSGVTGDFKTLLIFTSVISLILVVSYPFVGIRNSNFSNKWSYLMTYLQVVLLTAVFWAFAASSFTNYFLSFPATAGHQQLLKIAANYMFSWGVGFLAFFAPQGIGVFEVVAGEIMEMPMTLGGAVVFIAGFRLIVLISDILMWATLRIYQLIHNQVG